MVTWHSEADVVVIGAGATGLPAAIAAREAGSSVILVEAQPHLGGHAIISGGNVPLGGGTSAQKKHGIEDSPDLVFQDLTDWSVVQPNGFPDYRYNDREIVRAFADNNVADLRLAARPWRHVRRQGAGRARRHVGRQFGAARDACCAARLAAGAYRQAGGSGDQRTTYSIGAGLMYPLIEAARNAGVEILLEHKMTALHRETRTSGRVIGIEVEHRGTQPRHPGTQGGDHCHRRINRQRQLPPHVRSAPDRGILRPCGHAVVRSGRERGNRGDGGRRRAVGTVQPDRRVRLRPDQGRADRLPVRLSASQLAAGQPGF